MNDTLSPAVICSPARAATLLAAPAIVRAQGGAAEGRRAAAALGRRRPASARTASAASRSRRPILKDLGLPDLQIMNADTETNVEVARARAEKLIADGAQLLVGAFDSGQSTAIAQVAEQKGIPFVINIAAAPPITEQGYKFVFRNFPTAPMILGDAFANQKEIFEAAGTAPKSVVFMHVNDTFGTAMQSGIGARDAEVQHALHDRRDDRLRSGGARLSVEVAKAKATGAEALLVVSRLNDAILLTRELVKQRWTPMGVLEHGAGLVRGPVSQDARQARRRAAQLRALVRPEQEAEQALEAALAKAYPDDQPQHQPHLHLRGAAGRGRRLQARRLGRSEGAGRRDPRDQHHRQCHASAPASSSTPRARTTS